MISVPVWLSRLPAGSSASEQLWLIHQMRAPGPSLLSPPESSLGR